MEWLLWIASSFLVGLLVGLPSIFRRRNRHFNCLNDGRGGLDFVGFDQRERDD